MTGHAGQMFAAVKTTALPYLSAVVFSQSIATEARTVVDVVALAVLFGGVLVVARYKASLDAADKAAASLARERDAEFERANRLEQVVTSNTAKIATLEARPNVVKQQELLEQLVVSAHEQTALLRDLAERW